MRTRTCEHVVTTTNCRHGLGGDNAYRTPSFDAGALGVGSGPVYRFMRHALRDEAAIGMCEFPPTVVEIAKCTRSCCEVVLKQHDFDFTRRCVVCQTLEATLAQEAKDARLEQLAREERDAVKMREYDAELLEELREIFRRHGHLTGDHDPLIAALVVAVKEHTQWDY